MSDSEILSEKFSDLYNVISPTHSQFFMVIKSKGILQGENVRSKIYSVNALKGKKVENYSSLK